MTELDLTVGMYTYHRNKLLERHLEFLSLHPYKFKLILLDGSSDVDCISNNKKLAEKYGAIHFVESSTLKRMHFFFENVTTSFAAWSADDDLFSPDFYSKAIDFLKSDDRYSVVTGKLMTLHYARIKGINSFYLGNFLSNSYDIVEGDFVERIIRRDQVYANGCPPTFYGVRRYDNLAMFMKYIDKLTRGSAMERLEGISNLLFKGMKCLDTTLMGFRDYSSEAHTAADRDDPQTYISDQDAAVLKDIIKSELRPTIESEELLEYYGGYAWKLPLRPAQTVNNKEETSRLKRRIDFVLNRFAYQSNYGLQKDVFKKLKKVLFR